MTDVDQRSTALNRLPSDGPIPTPTLLTAPFWEGCNGRQLLYQRCAACNMANFEPTPACRRCGSPSLGWERSSGLGRLYSWVVVWRPQSPVFTVPYACCIVELDEGYRMLSSVADCTTADLADGLRVRVDFLPTESGQLLHYFQPDPR